MSSTATTEPGRRSGRRPPPPRCGRVEPGEFILPRVRRAPAPTGPSSSSLAVGVAADDTASRTHARAGWRRGFWSPRGCRCVQTETQSAVVPSARRERRGSGSIRIAATPPAEGDHGVVIVTWPPSPATGVVPGPAETKDEAVEGAAGSARGCSPVRRVAAVPPHGSRRRSVRLPVAPHVATTIWDASFWLRFAAAGDRRIPRRRGGRVGRALGLTGTRDERDALTGLTTRGHWALTSRASAPAPRPAFTRRPLPGIEEPAGAGPRGDVRAQRRRGLSAGRNFVARGYLELARAAAGNARPPGVAAMGRADDNTIFAATSGLASTEQWFSFQAPRARPGRRRAGNGAGRGRGGPVPPDDTSHPRPDRPAAAADEGADGPLRSSGASWTSSSTASGWA